MTTTISLKVWLAACFLACALLFGAAPVVHAQAVSYPSSSITTVDQFIAYLYQLIADLEAIKARQNRNYSSNTYSQSSYYRPTSQVQGIRYNSTRFDVETIGVRNTRDDETTMVGEFSLGNASYADVWFEYGEDDDLDDTTRKVRVDRGTRPQFSTRVTNLDENERFAFRAVAESANGSREYGKIKWFQLDNYYRRSNSSSNNDDEPDVTTDDARNIEDDRAELNGEVDMNDFDNGLVFFVYGEDEDQVEEVKDEDRYNDIVRDGDDLQKVLVDSDLDGSEDYSRLVTGLDDNTDHYFRICVEYEDEDDDEVLECGDVEDFETD